MIDGKRNLRNYGNKARLPVSLSMPTWPFISPCQFMLNVKKIESKKLDLENAAKTNCSAGS